MQEVHDVERRFAEEPVCSLVFECEKSALDGADAGRRNVAVGLCQLFCVVGDVGEHCPQVLEVEQKQSALVGHTEEDGHHACLHFVQLHEAGEEHGAHVGDGGAHGVAFLAEDVVEADRCAVELRVGNAEFLAAFLDERGHLSCLRDAREVAFHVGHEAGYACLGERLGQHLQGDSLACTRGAGYEAVAVRHLSVDANRAVLPVCHI